MKVAFIIPSLNRTGPVILLYNLVKGLMELYVECHIYYFDKKVDIIFPCKVERIKYHNPISFDNYDIIHSHCFRADCYVNKWRRYIRKAKTVSTIHQDTYKSFRFDYPYFLAKLFTFYWFYIQKKNDRTCCISEQILDTVLFHDSNHLITIYNGVCINDSQLTDLHKKYNMIILELKSKYKLLCTYARIVKRKNIEQILYSLPQLKDYAFVIIGDGPYKSVLQHITEELRLQDRVLFLDFLENPFLLLENVDVYVMPSYSEGFGLSMVEAALMRKAISCSDIPSFHEIFPADEAEFFSPGDIDSTINAIQRAYKSRFILGLKAYNRCAKAFTYRVMSERYLQLYNDILCK